MANARKTRWTYGLVSYVCNVIATFSFVFFVFALFTFGGIQGTLDVWNIPEPRVPGLEVWADTWSFNSHESLPWWLNVLGRIDRAAPLLCLGIGAYVLGEVVRSVQAGHPFDHRNPRRIVTLAVLVAVGGTGMGLLHYVVTSLLLARLQPDQAGLDIDPHLDTSFRSLVIAGVLLVVAAAFRQGRRLTVDVEGLV